MTAKNDCLMWISNLNKDQRAELFIYLGAKPYSLNVVRQEVDANTELGKMFLKRLGFIEDEKP